MIRLLLVDDQRADYVLARDVIEDIPGQPYRLDWESEYEKALDRWREGDYDLVLLDYMLGSKNGIDLLREGRASGLAEPVIMLTAVGERAVDEEALRAGASDYLTKNEMTAPLLDRTIRYALLHHEMHEQLQRSRDDLSSILDELRIGTVMTDHEGAVSFANRACERLFGLPREKLVGRDWRDLAPIDETDARKLAAAASLPANRRSRVLVHWESLPGRHTWAEIEIQDDPRDSRRLLLVYYDVSALHDLRRMLDKRARFGDIVGKSRPMQLVYEQIQELAKFDSTVLIEGETGTGKELVARAIHYGSHRSDKPFIAVNASGLTDSLLASQLFGHRRGAFTGAVDDQTGFFEAAQGGTLFLDELTDVPHNVQTSLLRVLQEREIVRLGDSVPRKIDVRVLAATNRDLTAVVAEGKFRPDLLYRIRVARVVLPPLRDRREDIPLLAEAFLQKFRAESPKEVEEVDQEAMRLLLRHEWPGNVRELQNAIESAAIRCRGSVITSDDLPAEVGLEPTDGVTPDRDAEYRRIQDALVRTDNNRAKAARLLGVSRTTLYRKLAEMGLDLE
jgi:PAS domain S-box-containing protein